MPAGVTAIQLSVWGSGGRPHQFGSLGGGGAFVQGTAQVTPGEVLVVGVGGTFDVTSLGYQDPMFRPCGFGDPGNWAAGGGMSSVGRLRPANQTTNTSRLAYIVVAGGGNGGGSGNENSAASAPASGACGSEMLADSGSFPIACYHCGGGGGGWQRSYCDNPTLYGTQTSATSCAPGLSPGNVSSFNGSPSGIAEAVALAPYYDGNAGKSGYAGLVVISWPALSAAVSPTRSSSPSPTRCCSSGTSTAAGTSTGSGPAAATASCSASLSSTVTVTVTQPRLYTVTATVSPTRPGVSVCRAPVNKVNSLRGARGSFPPTSLAVTGNAGMYTRGSCLSGYSTLVPGPRAVYFLDLGQDIILGGTLTVTTCGQTANNTVLYVGTGCPAWSAAFACRQGNDNAGDVPGRSCAGNPRASTVVIPGVSSRTYFLQIGGYNGGAVTTGVAWEYVAVGSAPGTASRSRTRSPWRVCVMRKTL